MIIELGSPEKDQLFTALALAQMEFPTIRVNRKAFKNEYADIYAILRPIYPVLHKYNLSVTGWSGLYESQGKLIQLKGVCLGHKSGQYMINPYIFEIDPIKGPQDQLTHKIGGSLTYFARYYIKDILGALISDDPEDNDLQDHLISKQQCDILRAELTGYKEIERELLAHYKIIDISHLSYDKYETVLDGINRRKNPNKI